MIYNKTYPLTKAIRLSCEQLTMLSECCGQVRRLERPRLDQGTSWKTALQSA